MQPISASGFFKKTQINFVEPTPIKIFPLRTQGSNNISSENRKFKEGEIANEIYKGFISVCLLLSYNLQSR